MFKQKVAFFHQEEVICLTASTNPSTIQSNGDLCRDKVETFQQWTDLSETYSCKRREVISHDGVVIPLTILYSQKIYSNGNSPGRIYEYGAYGKVLDKNGSTVHISFA